MSPYGLEDMGKYKRGPNGMSLEDRFWNKVRITTECWEWQGAIKPNGYGVLFTSGRAYTYVHRLRWSMANGPIPPGKQVNHHCDNRRCVRLSHLYLGTQKDNIQDAVRRGRHFSPWRSA